MYATFGERLKELREEQGLSGTQLAKKLNLHHSSIYKWEEGSQVPILTTAIQLAKFFDVTLDYIAGLTEY